MIRRHPSNDALRRWLQADNESDLPEVTEHVDDCLRCATRLEELAAKSDAELDSSGIASALVNLLAPPEGLSDRVEDKVNDRLSSRQVVSVLGDLFGAGFETSKLLLTEEDNER